MDQDSLRAIATLLVFLAFIGLSFSVFRKSRKTYFEDAPAAFFSRRSHWQTEVRCQACGEAR